MPEKVEDEIAALNQFKTEFSRRYCIGIQGPNFTTKAFIEAKDEAFCGPAETRKALGNVCLKFWYNTFL